MQDFVAVLPALKQNLTYMHFLTEQKLQIVPHVMLLHRTPLLNGRVYGFEINKIIQQTALTPLYQLLQHDIETVQKLSGHFLYTRDENIPFFFGPLQMTASSGLDSKNPMDITDKLSSTYCKEHTKHSSLRSAEIISFIAGGLQTFEHKAHMTLLYRLWARKLKLLTSRYLKK